MTLLLTAPILAVAAVPNMFTSGTTISSSAVNQNFTSLDARISALENAKTTVSIPIDYPKGFGPLPISSTFTSSGGTLVITVSGTAYAPADGSYIGFDIYLDGTALGYSAMYANIGNVHMTLPTRVVTAKPAAGTHTLQITADSYYTLTTTDYNDFYWATVVESH
jgi:hypothetical protein